MITRLYKSLPQHLKVASISWISRGIFVLATLYAIKIATSLLTVNQFAIYAVIANIVNWLLLTDLGLGYSVQNFISENKANKTSYKEYVLVCLSITYIIGIIIGIALIVFNDFFTNLLFSKILSANSIKLKELKQSFLYSNIAGLLTGIGMVSHKILYAKQKGYWPNILNASSAIITLILLWHFKQYDIHSLTWVLLVFFLPNIIISFLPSLYMFVDACIKCYTNITAELVKNIYIKIIRRGINFFVFTLSSAIVLQIDYIVMSQTVSASEISLYNIIFKIYSAFFLVYSTLLLALWPSIAEWYANKEFNRIITYCKKYILFGIIFIVLASVAFAYKTNLILSLISNLKFKISLLTIILFAIYFSVRVWTDTYSIILLSTSKVKLLWIFTPIQAVISISLQIILSKMIGINGIVCALILSFLLTVTWGLPYQVRKILK